MGNKESEMLKSTKILSVAASLLLAGTVTMAVAQEEKPNPKLAKQAKVTMAQARETASAKVSGKIEGSELEKERGKLIYSFDIRNAKGTISEVQVDAKTGKVISVQEENAKAEAAEKKKDAAKKKH